MCGIVSCVEDPLLAKLYGVVHTELVLVSFCVSFDVVNMSLTDGKCFFWSYFVFHLAVLECSNVSCECPSKMNDVSREIVVILGKHYIIVIGQ